MNSQCMDAPRVSCAVNLDLSRGWHAASARIEWFEASAGERGADARLQLNGWIDRGALDARETLDVEALVRGGVLRRAKDGVRLLGRGEIKVALQFAVHGASKSAIAAVEKAGGAVKVLAPPKSSPASGGA